MVGVYDAPLSGRLLDVRAPVLRDVPLTSALYELVSYNETISDEGYVRIRRASGLGTGNVELRYTIAANIMNQTSLVQLGLRMSKIADSIGRSLQAIFGGSLVKSSPTE